MTLLWQIALTTLYTRSNHFILQPLGPIINPSHQSILSVMSSERQSVYIPHNTSYIVFTKTGHKSRHGTTYRNPSPIQRLPTPTYPVTVTIIDRYLLSASSYTQIQHPPPQTHNQELTRHYTNILQLATKYIHSTSHTHYSQET